MSESIFVKLPVKVLGKTRTLFGAIGFAFNAQFTDHTAACMIAKTVGAGRSSCQEPQDRGFRYQHGSQILMGTSGN